MWEERQKLDFEQLLGSTPDRTCISVNILYLSIHRASGYFGGSRRHIHCLLESRFRILDSQNNTGVVDPATEPFAAPCLGSRAWTELEAKDVGVPLEQFPKAGDAQAKWLSLYPLPSFITFPLPFHRLPPHLAPAFLPCDFFQCQHHLERPFAPTRQACPQL